MLEFMESAWMRFSSSDALIAAVVTGLLPLALFVIQRWIAPRVRLRYGIVCNMVMLPKKPDGTPGELRVQRLRFLNTGNKAAEDVQIIFNWAPQHIEQYPHIAERDETKTDGRYIVYVPRINGGESFDISIASDLGELPAVIYVRGKEAVAKVVRYRDYIWYGVPAAIAIATLMLLGLFAFIYLLVVISGWVFFGRVA